MAVRIKAETREFNSARGLISIDGGNVDPTFMFDFETSNGATQFQPISFSMGPTPGGTTTGFVTTQFDQSTVTNFVEQDGFAPGTLSALEKSNVDLAAQFVNLIVAQRAFQANTRTVSVANELLANLVALGQ